MWKVRDMFSTIVLILFINCPSISSDHSIIVRRYSTPLTMPFPFPPDCTPYHKRADHPMPVMIQLWLPDMSKMQSEGYLFWDESITSSCTRYFFGSEQYEIKSHLRVLPENFNFIIPASMQSLPFNSLLELSDQETYKCKWPVTTENTVTLKYGQKRQVHISLTNSINLNGLLWEQVETHPGWYKSIDSYLFIPPHPKGYCPVKAIRVESGILNYLHDGHITASIPNLGLQFLIKREDQTPFCESDHINVYRSRHGYLISWSAPDGSPLMNSNRSTYITQAKLPSSPLLIKHVKADIKNVIARIIRGITNPIYEDINSEPNFSSLATEWTYSNYHYDMNYLIGQTNDMLIDIQLSTCRQKSYQWSQLEHPNLPTKLAKYFTGDPFAYGEFDGTLYKIFPTEIYRDHFSIPVNRSIVSGFMKLTKNNDTTIFVQPISGVMKVSNISAMVYHSTLLKTTSGDYIDYVTGEIHVDLNNIHPKRIQEIEAKDHLPRIGILEDQYVDEQESQFSKDGKVRLLPSDIVSGWFTGIKDWIWGTVESIVVLIIIIAIIWLFIKIGIKKCTGYSKLSG